MGVFLPKLGKHTLHAQPLKPANGCYALNSQHISADYLLDS